MNWRTKKTAVYIPLESRGDILYGLFVTYPYINEATQGKGSSWSMHIYASEKGRHRGSIYQKRQAPTAVLLTFEIKVADLIKQSKMATVLPREINVDNNAIHYLESR